jgi:hypothetical protein
LSGVWMKAANTNFTVSRILRYKEMHTAQAVADLSTVLVR